MRTPGLYPEDARRDYPARSRERFPDLEHFQGEPFDPRYHEDPREYRDFRDPFEQDIRKYTYIQRERERERERFEADRGRWSPSHPRRPITPTVSPSPSEHAHRDSERRVYSQSSERSGSASSLSPPHFEKSDKTPLEHSSKGDKTDKNAQADRVASAEKGKRVRRKDKGDKDKGEKIKSRKPKAQSPCNPPLDAEPEPGFDAVSERGKGSEQDANERQKIKVESDPLGSNQLPTVNLDSIKSERTELAIGDSDVDGKNRGKKHIKSENVNDAKESVDSDRLAARKRRFADASGRPIRPKRSRLDDEDGNHPDFLASAACLKDIDSDKQQKDPERRDSRIKIEKNTFGIQKDGQEEVSGQREQPEGLVDVLDPKQHPGHNSSRRFSHEGHMDQGSTRDPELSGFKYRSTDIEKGMKDREDHVDIDLSQSCRKQMEQNRRLHQQQQQQDFDKSDKPDSPQGGEMEDLEHRSLVHDVCKPPEDVTDNFPSHKSCKKVDQFDNDASIKKERVYRIFRQKTEEPDWNNTASPGLHHSPHHADEESVDQAQQKRPNMSDDKVHSDLELSVKQTRTTQIHKPNTPSLSIEEEQQKRWENRVKQDILPDLNFSRSLSKNIQNRKRLEFGVWHDLEPGEVRSDSEEDKEHKPRSPMPSSSMPFSERQRGDRISDPKLANLERNKFYSFALDQTITPDTKSLLERAKSLSSSREDNWSFLDYDSHFGSLRTRKDTEKVEATPRPTPSWYMKKKKIRSGSEDKLDDRKEEPKPEEQERRELFASRFLHSSIFEQDSRRLKHLERRHEEPEPGLNAQALQQGTTDDAEPAVLFRSRFLELTRQQQKGKEQLQPVVKDEECVQKDNKIENAPEPQQQPLPSPKMLELAMEPEIKPISPTEPRPLPSIIPQSTANEMSPVEEKFAVLSPSLEPPTPQSLIKEEKENPVLAHNPPTEVPKDSNIQIPAVVESSYPVQKVKPSPPQMADMIEDVKPQCAEQPSNNDAQEDFVSSSEPEMELETPQPDLSETISPRIPTLVEDADVTSEKAFHGLKTENDTENKFPVNKMLLPDNDEHEEPTSPPQKEQRAKEMKSKKHKQSPIHVSPVTAPSASNSEKPATRKSERIDKEKLKRGSSPRGDSSKINSEPKSSAKSPIYATDSDNVTEQSMPVGRTRRRNVKSVYATVEDDASVRTGKEITESPRSGRKRGGDKDATPQHNAEPESLVPVQVPSRRGRPLKNRKQSDDGSASKGDRSKTDAKENDSNESESGEKIPKMAKGKYSPSSKGSLSQVSVGTEFKESRKEEKTVLPEEHQEIEFMDEDSLTLEDSISQKDPSKVIPKVEDQDQQGADNCERQMGKDNGAVDRACEEKPSKKKIVSPVLEEKGPFEKDKVAKGKAKLTRAPKSPVLKNLKIRLNVTEVKDLLQLDEDNSNQEDISKKAEHSDPADPPSEPNSSSKVSFSDIDGEEGASEKEPQDAAKSFLTQELELVQAVENIAKLTGSALPAKPPTPPVAQPELKSDTEEQKPSNPASETELIAAIDSITADDLPAPLPPTAPVIDTDVDSEPELQVFIPPEKDDETEPDATALPEEPFFPNTPKKGPKGRPKTPKRGAKQKPGKKEPKERQSVPEESTCPQSDSTDSKLKSLSEVTPPSSATAAVITATTWKPEPESSTHKASDDKAKSESSSIEQLQELKPICPTSKSLICPKLQQQLPENISPSLSPSPGRPNIRPIQPNPMPVSPPDWLNQTKEIGVSPSPVLPAALENHPNQSLPPEPENIETEHSTSDLRKILMKPKNISRLGPITSNLPTPRDPPSETTTQSSALLNKCPLPDIRMPTPAQPVVRQPASLLSPESKSVITVIASAATSVISRVCNPPDTEEKINMTAGNPSVDMAKQPYRPSIDDGGSYAHGPSVGEEGGSAGRFIVETTNLSTGSSPGLRVNTSEGVVVLSHSGQKMEGPQRISAKISQIPQATPVDIESQQLVSMPQIKQELYSHPQSQKGPPPLSDHGHPGKTQSASMKQENTGLEKMESVYQSGPQGVVKRLGNQQVMSYHHPEYLLMKHQKKVDATDSHSADGAKTSWTPTISPAISPHLPSPPGNHVGFVSGASGDRTPSHLGGSKPEPRSPRKSGHPHSPFTKVSSPIGSSSPKGIPVMLPSGIAPMQQYVHHQEQSVIMPPHSGLGRMSPHPSHVSQAIPMGHLVQDVRVNTPPLSVMNFGIHAEPLGSPWSGSLQPRPTSPQAVGRDMVLKVNPGSVRGHEGEPEDARRFHQVATRPPVTQLKAESLQAGSLRAGIQMDTYMTPRDMRVLLHQQGERAAPDQHGGHIQDALPPSTSSNIPPSLSPRAQVLKPVSEKDVAKSLESKRPHSPHAKDSIMGIRPPGSAIASPQRVQLIPPASSGSFPEYSGLYPNPRSIHQQMPESSPAVLSQSPVTITPTMVGLCCAIIICLSHFNFVFNASFLSNVFLSQFLGIHRGQIHKPKRMAR